MCSPAVAIAATVASTAVSAYGAMQQGKAQAAQMRYQAGVDRNNAIINERYAQDAIKRGQAAEAEHRRKVGQLKGTQRAGFAANGIDLSSDLVSNTLSDTAMFGELDALTIRNNAEREAYGHRVNAMNNEASAGMNEAGAKNARSAGKLNAFSTVLGGAGTISGQYTDAKELGYFGGK